MACLFRSTVMRSCAVALLAAGVLLPCTAVGQTHDGSSRSTSYYASPYYPAQQASWNTMPSATSSSQPIPAAVDLGAWDGVVASDYGQLNQATPVGETWIGEPKARPYVDDHDYIDASTWGDGPVFDSHPSDRWTWQVLPDGLIYRSYQAGAHEPRLSILAFREMNSDNSYWDGTLGGRVGLLRHGTCDPLFPQGWQLDVEAAALIRMTLDEIRDFETADYRVGIPITYGVGNWQFKFAVYHLSSHLGDEFAIAHPGSLDERINYVRDALVVGASYFPHPAVRLYSEAAYAVNVDGGAEPWEFQFGSELSRPGPTGMYGTPFFATNAHLREEHNFGGDITFQAGWLWRGRSGQVTRAGLHYFNGKSSQYQIFDDSEQQLGFGLWYDY